MIKINKNSFDPFYVQILFQNASSHSVSDFSFLKSSAINHNGLTFFLLSQYGDYIVALNLF